MSPRRTRTLVLSWLICCSALLSAGLQNTALLNSAFAEDFRLTEFLALNQDTLTDEDGDSSDWLEFQNTTGSRLEVGGWSVTDDRRLLRKWVFPSLVLEPGEFLVVFASDKNRTDPSSELHTNFKLAGQGEYLAVVLPDGVTISQEFVEYPAQRVDASYGLADLVTTETLVGEGDRGALQVPTNGGEGLDWTAPGYVDEDWSAITLGVGFDAASDGPLPADELRNLARGAPTTQTSTLNAYTSNLGVDGNFGNFTHTRAGSNLPATWEVDLEGTFAIERIVLHNRTACCGSRLRDITVFVLDRNEVAFESELLNAENWRGGGGLSGPASLTVDFVERMGRGVIGDHVRVVRTPDLDLSGSGGEGGPSEPDVLSLGEVDVIGGAPVSLGRFVATDVEAAMMDANASVYLRLPFEVTDPDAFASLKLSVRYDDGFVAYLGGVEVARRNAPAAPAWNSSATRQRSDNEAIVVEEIDLSVHLPLLEAGGNVLAIHGLNVTADDDDFLLAPELVAESFAVEALRFFRPPTPAAPNEGGGFRGFVADTRFSVDRGFHSDPFQLEVGTMTEGAQIRYTLDGSAPTEDHGIVYGEPFSIETTTTVRAAAFSPELEPTNVDTHTYLFLEDVIRQPQRPAGFPSSWGSRVPDYAMDPDVVDDPAYKDEILQGLTSIRTLSIVVDQDDFFSSPRGIYANPRLEGPASERPISMEFLHPHDAGKDLQIDCGIRIHGNGSRNPGRQPKHGFRVEFRAEYGAKTLRYELFAGSPVSKFDSLILRGQNAHGWTRSSQIPNNVGTEREQSQYIRDSFARDLHAAMGNVAGHATYVHLYINGLYWGLYNPVEYPRAFFGASHLGGDEDEYDAINRRPTSAGGEGTHAIDGTKAAWNAMQQLANSGLTTPESYAQIQEHIDLDNLIDYMLVHQYMGSRDGPDVFASNNMRAVRRSRGAADVPWHCMLWDMEASMFEINVTRNVNVDQPDTLVRVYTRLRENAEFRLRYADRVHAHCFHNGTLTPHRTEDIWEARAEEIYTAIIGESARWGDVRRARPFTRDVEWAAERNRLLTTYFPTRTDFLVNLLRGNRLYPELDAPSFVRHGGRISEGFSLAMTVPEGAVYYTMNGVDPRLSGGEPSPDAILLEEVETLTLLASGAAARILVPTDDSVGLSWTRLDFDDSSWRIGTAAVGYERNSGFEDVIETDVEASMFGQATSIYIRVRFEIDDPSSLEFLTLKMKYDDGFVGYLNGVEIARANAPAVPAWNSPAARSHADSRALVFEEFDIREFRSELRSGTNVLAIHGMNRALSNSDFLVLPEISAVDGSAGSGVPIRETATVKARALDLESGEWSALEEALFFFDVPLRITELMYHPRDPDSDPGDGPAADEFEYVELQNVGDEVLELSGFRLDGAVSFAFSEGAVDRLRPGEVVLVVRDLEAFASRYDVARILIAGDYGGNFSNAGERVVLTGPAGEPILDFDFRDDWHPTTDGGGSSLTIVDALATPESWSERTSWRPSVQLDGTPGVADAIGEPPGGWQISGDANQDSRLDLSDGLRELHLLFAAGASPPPCEESLSSPGNRTLLDANGDARFDLSDPIYLLNYLFVSGRPPVAGTDCQRVEGCGDVCAE